MIRLRGGMLVTPSGIRRADIMIEDGRIAGIGAGSAGGKVLDCSGCLIGPGFVDIHVHFREPGQTWKEDIETGSRAAAAGGFTGVVPMANTDPATDRGHLVESMVRRGDEVGLVEVRPAAALTAGRRGDEVGPIEELWEAGVRIFSDDGDSVARPEVLEEAMVRIGRLGGVAAQHAEEAALTAGGHIHEGIVSAALGIGGLPAEAEERVVARDLVLAARTGVRYHVQHVSTAGTVSLVRAARSDGVPVTAEAAPHHFSLDHRRLLDRNPVMKMYPPLRTADDVAAVAGAVRDGTIEVIATDHAPHTSKEKEVALEDAPRGIIGLETSASIAWSILEDDPVAFFQRMAVAPAHLAEFVDHGQWLETGGPANVVVFDPDRIWTPEHFESRSQNSPWLGTPLRGRPVVTIYKGLLTNEVGR
ncbi:MAG: dihydroorotase [Acidimicrobiia bacterium]|nr:dihydroorotase [Acidimicrobiia bacterium]